MLLGILGDLHGAFDALERAVSLEPAVAAWLCVGDVGSESGDYPRPSRPFFFIKGNNEDFDVIARLAAGEAIESNLHLVPNGAVVEVPPRDGRDAGSPRVRVAGLGGTLAPKWYDTAPGVLPDGSRAGLQTRRRGGPSGPPRDDKRRHFVRSEVEACLRLEGIDVFLTHEAPRPYWVGTGRRRNDAGKAVINEILAALRPRLHVFGHHHRFSERVSDGVPSVGLPLAAEGYLRVETEGWTWSFCDSAI